MSEARALDISKTSPLRQKRRGERETRKNEWPARMTAGARQLQSATWATG